MEGEVQKLIEKTGVCVPLAAQMVGLILDSGASDMEARVAMKIVDAVLVTLPISYRPDELRAP